jgi:hypothetical protein
MLKLALLFVLISCSSAKNSYPTRWWKAVAEDSLLWWEIGPGAAKKGQVVLSKRNELGILSNFSDTPFKFKGKKYATVEGLWQSMKYPESKKDIRFSKGKWPHTRAQVEMMQGFEAKRAGYFGSDIMKDMDMNWVTFEGKRIRYKTPLKGEHYKIIRAAMIEKLNQNPKVKEILLSTGKLALIPDHLTKESDPPAWKYHIIWMEIRDHLRKE